ncbi:MAG: hypothetical protein ACRD2C_10200 [Acidimicrobiales bacterium]
MRSKHQNKDLEKLLKQAEKLGWRVGKGKKYFMMRCPCGQHQRTVKLTPSDPNYGTNLRAWLKRTGCWED